MASSFFSNRKKPKYMVRTNSTIKRDIAAASDEVAAMFLSVSIMAAYHSGLRDEQLENFVNKLVEEYDICGDNPAAYQNKVYQLTGCKIEVTK